MSECRRRRGATTEALNTQTNAGGMFVISDVSSRAPDDRDLVFLRVGAVSDPTAPNAAIGEQAGWPNDGFLGWLENLHEGVIATEPVEMTVKRLRCHPSRPRTGR